MCKRICTSCGVEYPATTEYFYADKTVRNGLASKCKLCRKKQMNDYTDVNRNIINERARTAYNLSPEKTLLRCKQYRQLNKDKVSARNQTYYQNNKERYAEYGKQYRESNPDKVVLRHKKYYAENSNERKKYEKSRKHDPHYKKLKSLAGQRRRNAKKSLPNNFTAEQWELCKASFDNRCAYCGEEKPLTMEHFIPLSKRGEFTANNIIPACESCNKSKVNRDFFVWYPKQSFYSKQRELKILRYLNYDPKTRIQQLSIL